MYLLSQLLKVGAELHSLSRESAEKHGVIRRDSASGRSTTMVLVSRDGRIRIARSGSVRTIGCSEEIGISIDGKPVYLSLLTDETRALLEEKVNAAFQPLKDALAREREEGPKRVAQAKEEQERKQKREQKAYSASIHTLFESL